MTTHRTGRAKPGSGEPVRTGGAKRGSGRPKVRTVMVSACLLGKNCRYDGDTARAEAQDNIRALRTAGLDLVGFCPEEHGGLGTPRPPAHIVGGDGHRVLDGAAVVRTEGGVDVTAGFIAGAEGAAACARDHGATAAVLKARSPSCGKGRLHGDSGLIDGDGVAAALLSRRGLVVLSDEDFAAHPEKLLGG